LDKLLWKPLKTALINVLLPIFAICVVLDTLSKPLNMLSSWLGLTQWTTLGGALLAAYLMGWIINHATSIFPRFISNIPPLSRYFSRKSVNIGITSEILADEAGEKFPEVAVRMFAFRNGEKGNDETIMMGVLLKTFKIGGKKLAMVYIPIPPLPFTGWLVYKNPRHCRRTGRPGRKTVMEVMAYGMTRDV
jgi:hypothetical protein